MSRLNARPTLASYLERMGVLPSLVVCAAAVAISVLWLNGVVNTLWVVPPDHPAFRDVQRAVVNGTADSTTLLAAADWRLLAVFLAAVALFGLGCSLPLVYYANRSVRLRRDMSPASFLVLLRQALWVGLWLAFAVWLQMQRTFGWPIVLLLGVIFVLLELFVSLRLRSAVSSAPAARRP